MSRKMPYIQFYPGDWLRDAVSGCSLAAQGLWLRMMMVMHDSDRYGYLSQNGKPMPLGAVRQRCGASEKSFDELMNELTEAGVPSVSEDGFIYSRRMVKDHKAREANALRQKKHYDKVSKPNGQPNALPNAILTPIEDDIEDEDETVVSKEKKTDAEKLYDLYPRKVGKGAALKAIGRALKSVSFDELAEAVGAYAESRRGQDQQFTPYPATWFNEGRWMDDRATWRPRETAATTAQNEFPWMDEFLSNGGQSDS